MLLGGEVQFMSKNKIKLMKKGIVGDMNFISTAFYPGKLKIKDGIEGQQKREYPE